MPRATFALLYLPPSFGVSGLSAFPLSKLQISLNAFQVSAISQEQKKAVESYLEYWFSARNSFLVRKIDTSGTLPSGACKPSWARLVQFPSWSWRLIAAEGSDQWCYVLWFHGLYFFFRSYSSCHVCTCWWSNSIDKYIILCAFSWCTLCEADDTTFLCSQISIELRRKFFGVLTAAA